MKEKPLQSENWKIHQASAKEELSEEGLLMGAGRGGKEFYLQK